LGIELAGEGAGRLFGLDFQTVIQVVAHLINVGLLAFILVKLLYKPVQNFLLKRVERIKGELDHAGDEMAKANELKLQYEQKMKDVELARDEILGEARKAAADEGRQIVADAKKEADAVKERAAANVDLEWDRAQTAMRQAIVDVASAMTEKFVTLAINKETHDQLFADTMSELEGMTWRS